MGLFETRILLNAPEEVPYSTPVRLQGKLEWYCPPVMCPPFGSWIGYGNQKLNVIVDGTKVGEVYTIEDGSFSYDLRLTLGIHKVEVYYPGSWKDNPSSGEVVVKVVSPSEYRSYEIQNALQYFLIALAIPVSIYAVAKAVER